MTQTLIIMAAGASSRMKSSVSTTLEATTIAQANSRTKGLIEIGDNHKSLLYYLLCNAQKAGYKKVYLIIGADFLFFKSIIEKLPDLELLEFIFVIQRIPDGRSKPLGTADAILQAVDQFPDLKKIHFSVCNSDNLYSVKAFQNLRKIEINHGLIAYDINYLDFSIEKLSSFGILVFNSEFILVKILEKPSVSEIKKLKKQKNVYVSMNCFTFNGATFYPFLKQCPIHPIRNEKELPLAVSNMIEASSEKVLVIPMQQHVPDLTIKEDILHIKNYLVSRNLD
tara:strand:- start:6523 stop:7368 length:846 start_codon:yes stop_codon:yes gene_type:complete